MFFHDITNLPFSLNPSSTALQIRKGVGVWFGFFFIYPWECPKKITKSYASY